MAGGALTALGWIVALKALEWMWWRTWVSVVAGDAAALCVAGVALGDSHLPAFRMAAWRLVTSTFMLHGKGGTQGTKWQAWRLATSTYFVWRGRSGTWRHPPSFCAARVALGDVDLHCAWQEWHLLTSIVWQVRPLVRATCVSRGRRGTYGTGLRLKVPLVAGDAAALGVAGVALGDIHLRFARQAWHLVTSTFVLRSRRGTYGTGLDLLARLGPLSRRCWHLAISTFVLRGRRGTW